MQHQVDTLGAVSDQLFRVAWPEGLIWLVLVQPRTPHTDMDVAYLITPMNQSMPPDHAPNSRIQMLDTRQAVPRPDLVKDEHLPVDRTLCHKFYADKHERGRAST
ncbi:hypothetical protein AC1031_010708 [Aphanomyces cochlioides]|nr:hypothetical protein AC1031_010708 [Aphanomyces cochlioides]